MLDYLKSFYHFLPKESLWFLRYIPNNILYGFQYGKWQSKISFQKNIIEQNLFETMLYSRENTQYGRDNIPKDLHIKNVKEILISLPLVSSQDLSANLDYYTSQEYTKKNAYITTTGGTGRSPTSILLSNASYSIEWAHIHNIWGNTHYDRTRNIKLTLRGKSLKNDELIEYSPLNNEIIVDTFKVNEKNFQQFMHQIQKYHITYLHGYPSLVKEFMEYFRQYSFRPNIKAVFLGSEGASVVDKQIISTFFQCPVLQWYGQSEKVCLAADFEANNIYKVYTSYGYPRIVNNEIVATSFVNRALPLINYKTGDTGNIIEDENHIYIKDIQGRWGKDFVYLDTNKKIPTSSINLHSVIQNEILFYQLYQKEFGKLEIRILQKTSSQLSQKKLLKIFSDEMKKNLNNFILDIKLVDAQQIIKSHRGKQILLVQDLIVNH